MNAIPLPCPFCERPARRVGADITCARCGLTWTADTTPADGAKWPGDLALCRFLVEGYAANVYRAETAALAGDTDAALRSLQKAADYFTLTIGTIQ